MLQILYWKKLFSAMILDRSQSFWLTFDFWKKKKQVRKTNLVWCMRRLNQTYQLPSGGLMGMFLWSIKHVTKEYDYKNIVWGVLYNLHPGCNISLGFKIHWMVCGHASLDATLNNDMFRLSIPFSRQQDPMVWKILIYVNSPWSWQYFHRKINPYNS